MAKKSGSEHKNSKQRERPKLRLKVSAPNGRGVRVVVAEYNRQEVHRDSINTDCQESRKKFLRAVAKKLKSDPVTMLKLDAKIVELAAEADEDDDVEADNVSDVDNGSTGGNQASKILDAIDLVELFRTPENEAFATIDVEGHREHWPVRSSTFKQHATHCYYMATDKAPSSQSLSEAIATLEAKARFEGEQYEVFLRVGEYRGAIYVDLCNDNWSVVKITPSGFRVIKKPKVRFRRTNSMQALPKPAKRGNIEELRKFLNLEDEDAWFLLLAWLIATYLPTGPYPIKVSTGEKGAAKTMTARILRKLIDPQIAGLRSDPKNLPDLVIAAKHCWVLAFDNLSFINDEMSDALCRLSTGGGFGKRQLYTDAEETFLDVKRAISLNGIEELTTRGDLLDRSIVLHFPAIPSDKRRAETDIWSAFEKAQPRILGAIFNAVSTALRNRDSVRLDKLPRMADFALWVAAAAPALGFTADKFMRAYNRNLRESRMVALQVTPILAPLVKFMQDIRDDERASWTGTATKLYDELWKRAKESHRKRHNWPKNPQRLSMALRRMADSLREIGLIITNERSTRRDRTRLISIKLLKKFQQYRDPSESTPGEVPPDG